MIPPPRKRLLRVATAIHAALTKQTRQTEPVDLPRQTWERITQLNRQLRQAQIRGWQSAYRHRRKELQAQLERLRCELLDRRRELEPARVITASLRDVLVDLEALHQEFGQVQWNCRDGTLSVTTDSITLAGHYLGPFAIELHWRQLQSLRPYRVIALDPQPSGRDPSVSHPHVEDTLLCEGEGKQAVQAALAGGRLYDFFSLVSSILTTYNASSAYVALDEWSTPSCTGCGDSYREDDGSTCSRCEAGMCDNGGICCTACGDLCCSGCTHCCANCEDPACEACLETCTACLSQVCRLCLTDDPQICQRCHEQEPEAREESEQADAEAA